MILMSVVTARAGGPFESFDITGAGPSPIPGHLLARVIPIRWDARTIPVPYRINNTLDPIPNPLGPAFLLWLRPLRHCRRRLMPGIDPDLLHQYARSLGQRITSGLIGFDMINELTFRTAAGFGAIASSPSTNLIHGRNTRQWD